MVVYSALSRGTSIIWNQPQTDVFIYFPLLHKFHPCCFAGWTHKFALWSLHHVGSTDAYVCSIQFPVLFQHRKLLHAIHTCHTCESHIPVCTWSLVHHARGHFYLLSGPFQSFLNLYLIPCIPVCRALVRICFQALCLLLHASYLMHAQACLFSNHVFSPISIPFRTRGLCVHWSN